MRDITAVFENGTTEKFMTFKDLMLCMKFENHTDAEITVRYCLETIAEGKKVTFEDVVELAKKNEVAEMYKSCPLM